MSLGAGLGAPLLHRLDALGTLSVAGQSACLIGVLAILETTYIRRERARRRWTRWGAPARRGAPRGGEA